jgi:DNA-binding LytR/AlgR family response regulator
LKQATAIIAEDEPLLRTEIREALKELWPELDVLAEAADGIEAIRAIDQMKPDIVFLDIQMPGLTGLDVAAHVSGRAHVVFISAFDQHALAAFERGAIDYILKPIALARLKLAVERLQPRLRSPPLDLEELLAALRNRAVGDPQYLKWLSVPSGSDGSEIRIVTAGEVCYLRADHKYTTVVTRDASFLLTSSLKQMKEKLDPGLFWQIHRSIIVNVSAIDTVYRSFRGSLEIKLKGRAEILPVSSANAHMFKPA